MFTDYETLARSFNFKERRSSVIAIGNFDGVHRGHQFLLKEALQEAKREQAVSIVMTFEPHPQEFFGRSLQRLLTASEKAEKLKAFEFDFLLIQEFTPKFATLSAEEFCDSVLLQSLSAKSVVVGQNFRFGAGAKGNSELLKTKGLLNCQITLDLEDGRPVSSGRIRGLLSEEGKIKECNQLLGYSYFLSGRVVPGDSRGRTIGWPTANLETNRQCLPKIGVYACWAFNAAGESWKAAVNVGVGPTFDSGGKLKIEAHLLDFEGDLYGQVLRLEFVDRIRDEQKFSSLEDLKQRIELDCVWVRDRLQK